MKKILGIMFLGLLLSGNAFAELKELKWKRFDRHDHGIAGGSGESAINTACIDGYIFVAYSDYTNAHGDDGGNSTAVSIVQFFEERDGKSLPKKC
tara:strand:+ start:276 stop:560 length:285 start_codon:yes stop_codon:yes gene_type:complete